jgi:hypothetical protein
MSQQLPTQPQQRTKTNPHLGSVTPRGPRFYLYGKSRPGIAVATLPFANLRLDAHRQRSVTF